MKQPPAPTWLSRQRPPRSIGGGGGGGAGGDGAAAASGCGGLVVHPPTATRSTTITVALVATLRPFRQPFRTLVISSSKAEIVYQNVVQTQRPLDGQWFPHCAAFRGNGHGVSGPQVPSMRVSQTRDPCPCNEADAWTAPGAWPRRCSAPIKCSLCREMTPVAGRCIAAARRLSLMRYRETEILPQTP
jgi:hypothetical protein